MKHTFRPLPCPYPNLSCNSFYQLSNDFTPKNQIFLNLFDYFNLCSLAGESLDFETGGLELITARRKWRSEGLG